MKIRTWKKYVRKSRQNFSFLNRWKPKLTFVLWYLKIIENRPNFFIKCNNLRQNSFIIMTQNLSIYMHCKIPSSPRQGWTSQKFKAIMIGVLISKVQIDWCLKVKPFIFLWRSDNPLWANKKQKVWNLEERLMYSSPKQCTSTQRTDCRDIFGETQNPQIGTSILFNWLADEGVRKMISTWLPTFKDSNGVV